MQVVASNHPTHCKDLYSRRWGDEFFVLAKPQVRTPNQRLKFIAALDSLPFDEL